MFDEFGNIIRQYCFGDGINDVIALSDGQSVIFDKGYQKHGLFARESFIGDRLSAPEDVPLEYEGDEISLWRCTSRGALAAFIDNECRLFVKRFFSC